jgi:hypothetical protein
MVKAGLFRAPTLFLSPVGGDGDERDHPIVEIGPKPASDFVAIKVRKPDIEQRDVRMKLRDELESVAAVRRGQHFKPNASQKEGVGANDIDVIVYDKHAHCLNWLIVGET